MRAEDAGARTWLYAVLAGWAVGVWVLAMFGMGGSIERLDNDPSLQRALPSPGQRGAERLGPLPQYAEIGSRPLFTENRRPQPFVIDPMGEATEASNDFDYVLTSVLRTPDLQMVILQPAGGGASVRVRQGEAPESSPGWTLQSVDTRSAVFAGPQGERTLGLRVFDGIGGEAPTPVAVAPPQVPAAPGVLVPSPTSVANADAGAGPGGPVAQAMTAPGGAPVADAAVQQQAAQDQVDAIRRRIEERRARLRQEELANTRATQRANQKQ